MPPVDPWSALSLDPRVPQHRALRATDGDRAVVTDLLCEAYADGRLSAEELEERQAGVVRSRTLGELAAFVDDLVPPRTSYDDGPAWRRPDRRARALEHWSRLRREALWTFGTATTVCWTAWLVLSVGPLGLALPWPLLVMVLTGARLARVLVGRERVVTETTARLERLEGAAAVSRRGGPPG